jgi:plastocyanin
VHLAAVPGKLAFDTKSLKAKAGTVTLSMSNPSSFPHGISVQGNGVDKDGKVVQHGGTSTVTAKLKPGTYTFYCPVPGHRQAGMQGTLTVT